MSDGITKGKNITLNFEDSVSALTKLLLPELEATQASLKEIRCMFSDIHSRLGKLEFRSEEEQEYRHNVRRATDRKLEEIGNTLKYINTELQKIAVPAANKQASIDFVNKLLGEPKE